MDKLTESVRTFYEAYSYPAGNAVDLDGYHVRLLLSYLERPAPAPHRLRVLEAGCGRGLNLQAAAVLQPDIDFTGIDINRVAIEEAQKRVAEQGPANLHFATANLLAPDSLPTLEGGYDLILSYGVIHHLSEPLTGLCGLRDRLAPQGVMALMVDGRYGRQPLDRFLEALAMLEPAAEPTAARMEGARALARVAEGTLFKETCWQGSAEVDEVEFADRCLHVHEHSYDIDSLWQLLTAARTRFVRWREPLDWSLDGLTEERRLLEKYSQLDELRQYRLIERLSYRPKLTLVIAREGDRVRSPLAGESVAEQYFLINPQLKPVIEANAVSYRLRRQPSILPADSLEQHLLQAALQQPAGFRGMDIATRLGKAGHTADEVYDLLYRLERREWIYR